MKIEILMPMMMFFVFVVNVKGQNEEAVRQRAKLFESTIASTAARHGLDPHILWTIAYLESGFDPAAISYKKGVPCAFGLMQFIPSTAQKYGLTNPHDPRQSIEAGARYTSDLIKRFSGRIDLVLAAYNSGEGTVEAFRHGTRMTLSNGKIINPGAIRTGGVPPYKETQRYVSKGITILKRFRDKNLFTPSPREASLSFAESVYSSTPKPIPMARTNNRRPPEPKFQSLYVN